jgi:hypothetical protein
MTAPADIKNARRVAAARTGNVFDRSGTGAVGGGIKLQYLLPDSIHWATKRDYLNPRLLSLAATTFSAPQQPPIGM